MPNFPASHVIVDELDRPDASTKTNLLADGWVEQSLRSEIGQFSHEDARILHRSVSLADKFPEYLARFISGSKSAVDVTSGYRHSLNELVSVQNMRYNKDSLTPALDTEFVNSGKERRILSYQFAFYDPKDFQKIHEVVFLPVCERRLPLERMMSWILTEFNLGQSHEFSSAMRWIATVQSGKKYFKSPQEAFNASILPEEKTLLQEQFGVLGEPFRSDNNGKDGGYVFDFSDFTTNDVTLVCHWGQADLSTFDSCEKNDLEVIAHCSKIQGGLVTLKPTRKLLTVVQNPERCYNVSLNIRDTMCFAPAGQKSLKSLGNSISVKKIELPHNAIEHMDQFFSYDPVLYMNYASNDSIIALLYSSELWGINKKMPVTTTSGAVKAASAIIMQHFGVKNTEGMNLFYRGIVKKNYGKEKISVQNSRKFRDKNKLEAVSDDAFIIMHMAANFYSGGFNGCYGARFVSSPTHDYDLKNAYPTAMSCIIDPDWTSDNLIARTIEKRLLTLEDFNSPFDLMFGDIDFEFPKDIMFPCIPINVAGSLIFPRTSDGIRKCYASAPEMYLALKLGAQINAKRVYVASQKMMQDGTPSRCLYHVAKQFVLDRQKTKEYWGDKSSEQNLLKTSINAVYGKIAQNIKPKFSWNAASSIMEEIGCSSLTSPVHACIITGSVRAMLNASMNQLHKLGFECHSVTTDGFISNAPFEVLNSLDLYGFNDIFRDARLRLTGSPDLWEEKHTQASFLNFSTRGNVSQDLNGVCARNGFHSGYKDPDYGDVDITPSGLIDRYSTMLKVATRKGRICSHEKHFTGFKELSYHGDNSEKKQDLTCEERQRNLRMDFDMKRKPLEESFEQVFLTVNGVTEDVMLNGENKTISLPDVPNCEWMNFDSVPYENVAEYEMYKKVYNGMECLRTKNDWAKFWLKIHAINSGNKHSKHIQNVAWTILTSTIRGYRQGLWDIPALSDSKKTVKEKVAWIEKFNKSGKPFTESSWKNCGRKDRKNQMISKDDCKELLEMMLACSND